MFVVDVWVARFNQFLNRTHENLVLEHKRYGYKNKVEQEHCESETAIHSPFETSDAQYYKQQHAEEYGDTADHPDGINLHRFAINQTVQKPRDRKPVKGH